MGTEPKGGEALLVGLHVHGAADDDLQEKHRPLRGLLRAALYCVKHATHLRDHHSSVRWLRAQPSISGQFRPEPDSGAFGTPKGNAPVVPGMCYMVSGQ